MLTVFAVAIGAFTMTALASTDTNATSTTADNAVTGDTSQSTTTQTTDQTPFTDNIMMEQGSRGFGGGPGGQGRHGMMGGMGNIEVSSEYTANVNAILNNDTDIANLIAQGYNVTAINPIVKTVIQGDGTVATQATTTTVFMQGTSGFATVNVDIANAKVTQIVTVTRTLIDKSTS
jgi:hypothetical protein